MATTKNDWKDLKSIAISAILFGKSKKYKSEHVFNSAIDKRPVESEVFVSTLGIVGDEQYDQRFHGGVDKALHHYAYEHYPYWHQICGNAPVLNQPGAFGENISTVGLTEESVCLGDQFAIGDTVIVEVSQSRQPCWKLNHRFAHPDMAKLVQDTGKNGWYYRVLKEGIIKAGDNMLLLNRPYPNWSLQRVNHIMFTSEFDHKLFNEFLQLPLTTSWRKTIEQRLLTQKIESMQRRLYNID